MKSLLYILLLLPLSQIQAVKITKVNNQTSYIVMEKSSQRILEGSNINQQMLVASTAKILTAITAIENYRLDEEIIINKKDVSEVGSKVYFKENERIKRIDLLYALMLRSANDAASALSFNNDSQFIGKMNETAKKIGMKNSVFANASGLDEKEFNLSTAYDMALLSCYASKNKTFVNIASAHSYTCKTDLSAYSWINKHRLVKNDEAFIWGKTGYTKKSRRILVSNYLMDNKDLIIVTINDSNDWNHHRNLAQNTDSYNFITILNKGVYDPKVGSTYYFFVEENITVPLKKNEYEKMSIVFKLYREYAQLEVKIKNEIILIKRLAVYDKNSFDLDMLVFDL